MFIMQAIIIYVEGLMPIKLHIIWKQCSQFECICKMFNLEIKLQSRTKYNLFSTIPLNNRYSG